MSLKLNTPFPIFAPSLFPNPNPRAPSEIRFSRWGNANAERFEQRRRSQEELEAEIRRDRRFGAATKIVHTHDSEAAASEPKTSPFRSRGTPSLPSARSIPGRRSKYSKPDSGPNKPKNKPKVPDSPPQLDSKPEVKLSEDGLSYVINGAPFEFKYSYTETPKVKPLKLREPAYAEQEDCVLAVKFWGPQLSLCRPCSGSNSTWVNIRTPSSFFNSQVMYSRSNQMFLMPAFGGHYTGSWDLHKHRHNPILNQLRLQNLPKFMQSEWELLDSCLRREDLVESPTGESFLVKWYTGNNSSNLAKVEAKRFLVFKIDEKGNAC